MAGSEGQRIAQRIAGELRLALAAMKEVNRLVKHDDSPLTYLQMLLYSERCKAVDSELQQLSDRITTIVWEMS